MHDSPARQRRARQEPVALIFMMVAVHLAWLGLALVAIFAIGAALRRRRRMGSMIRKELTRIYELGDLLPTPPPPASLGALPAIVRAGLDQMLLKGGEAG